MTTPPTVCRIAALAWFTTASMAQPQPEAAAPTPGSSRNDAGPNPQVNAEIVDALIKRYGDHPGYRSNHAKGIIVEGTFTPSQEAPELSRSSLFAGPALPITVRFSDAGGLPHLPDASPLANPHGMAIKFHLPHGVDSDIVANALKFFTVATPEEFRDLQLAAATSPPGAPRSPQLQAFLESHPGVERANATLGIPASFADERYFGIDAFVFINPAGRRQAFRYVITPESLVHLSKEEAAARPPDYLFDELPRRLAKGPVTFHLKAQLAAPGDQTKDPTRAWPDDRVVIDLGTLTIDRTVADSDALQSNLLFTPGRLTDGIEPSDDPLIAARDGSYAVSLQRRNPALARAEFGRAMMNSMARMDAQMVAAPMSGDPDHDFAALMIPHHQAAIDMAAAYLRCGKDPTLLQLAADIMESQLRELDVMRRELAAGP
jgi:catalase